MQSQCVVREAGLAQEERRCGCGHLLAVVTEAGVEIKCKRCKTIQVIPLQPKDRGPLSPDPS